MCDAARARDDYRALVDALNRDGFAPADEAVTFDVVSHGTHQHSLIQRPFRHPGRPQQSCLLVYVEAESGESVAYAAISTDDTIVRLLAATSAGEIDEVPIDPRPQRRRGTVARLAAEATGTTGCTICEYACEVPLGLTCEAGAAAICGAAALASLGIGGPPCLVASAIVCKGAVDTPCAALCAAMACCGTPCEGEANCCVGAGGCTDLLSDDLHCGACYSPCDVGETCQQGVCGCGNSTCGDNERCCDGSCVASCPVGKVLNQETCQCECADGFEECGETCCGPNQACCEETGNCGAPVEPCSECGSRTRCPLSGAKPMICYDQPNRCLGQGGLDLNGTPMWVWYVCPPELGATGCETTTLINGQSRTVAVWCCPVSKGLCFDDDRVKRGCCNNTGTECIPFVAPLEEYWFPA